MFFYSIIFHIVLINYDYVNRKQSHDKLAIKEKLKNKVRESIIIDPNSELQKAIKNGLMKPGSDSFKISKSAHNIRDLKKKNQIIKYNFNKKTDLDVQEESESKENDF